MSPLERAFRARARTDLGLGPDDSLADAIRANAARETLYERVAARCAPEAPDTDVVPVSRSSLRRLLLGDTSLDTARLNTRDALARYLGYEDFADFERGPEESPVETPKTLPTRDGRTLWWQIAAGVGLLIAVALGYRAFAPADASRAVAIEPAPAAPAPASAYDPADTALARELHAVVRAYNRAEFGIYAAVPDIADTAALRALAWPDGESYPYVVRVAERHAREGNRLNRRRSNRQLIDLRLASCTDSTCLLETTEQWTLIWERPDGSALEYDVLNDQRYSLRERDGAWKVFANGYAGTHVVKEPETRAPPAAL